MRFLLILFVISTASPMGNLDRIKRSIDKMEFERAWELLEKARSKNPDNPGVDYFSTILYFTDNSPRFHLDSARMAINITIEKFSNADAELIEDLQDDNITLEIVNELQIEIRDRIYGEVLVDLTVSGAETFMGKYPDSPYQDLLVYKRDSIVFDQVRKNDQLGVYENFLEQYSTPEFTEVAEERIDELRYQVLAHSGKLPDYYEFLDKYPQTKFRNEIELYVFREATADHTKSSYLDFLAFAQNEKLKKKVVDILYYMGDGGQVATLPATKDSLDQVISKSSVQLFPTMELGQFGFHSLSGELIVPYEFENVDDQYKCELTADEWLFVQGEKEGKIINKNGHVLLEGVREYEDLGSGAAKVKAGGEWFLYHKSGFLIIEDPIEDAQVLKGRWAKVKKNGKWGLISYSGYEVTGYRFDDIHLEANYWVFERDGLLAVYTEELIAEGIRKGGLDLEFKFEDLELISETMLIGFRDDRECMLDENLRFLVPWGVYEINPDPSGWYLKSSAGYRLYDHSENDIMNKTHPYLETNDQWLALKAEEDWILLSRTTDQEPRRAFDSLRLVNRFCAYGESEDKRELIFPSEESIEIDSTTNIKTFYNRPEYLMIEREESKSILDSMGSVILKGTFDDITFFTDSLLRVKKDGKNGLLNLQGVEIVDIEFDIIDQGEDLILCLKDGKIGCVDLQNDVVISAISETRIERIGENYLVKNEGKYGLIDSLETTVLSYAFDEIRYWNDTSFLIRQADQWSFVNKLEEPIGQPFGFLSEVVSNDDESVWKFVRDGKYGLLSNKNGFLLDPEFTDIFNIGDTSNPVFFADQHLDKAGYHVVSYVDSKGNLILSKAYRKEEFDKILCDD